MNKKELLELIVSRFRELPEVESLIDETIEIRAKALELGYKPLVIDGLKKVLNGITTLDEINNKLIIY